MKFYNLLFFNACCLNFILAQQASFVGPDTINLPEEKIGIQGNWVNKREWVKEIENINNEIQELVINIQKSKKDFNTKFSTIEKEVDNFYQTEGFAQGKLTELFTSIEKYLNKKKELDLQNLKDQGKDAGVSTDTLIKINIVENEMKAIKADLEQLKLDIKAIQDLYQSSLERIKKLDEQIAVCVDLSVKSKEISDQSWYVIDDKKVRKSYYELKGDYLEKVKAIQTFINSDLSSDFDKVISLLKEQMTKVSGQIKAIEDKGIFFRNRSKKLEEIKLQDKEKNVQEIQKRQDLEKELREKREKEKQNNFFKNSLNNIYKFFVDFIARIINFTKKLFSFFGSSKTLELKKRDIITTSVSITVTK